MINSVTFLSDAISKTGKELKITNLHAYPRIDKLVVHIGFGKDKDNKPLIESLKKDMIKITGQKPSLRLSKKAIATFKLRANEPIGMMVTLRGKKMADFLSKLIHVTLPAVRDFRGVSQDSFDQKGNYSLGIREHTVFPEISFGGEGNAHGIQVTIQTTTNKVEEARALLKNLGFPFQNNSKEK